MGELLKRIQAGKLTGRLIEAANMEMSEVASYKESEMMKAVKIASDRFVAAGITSIHDAGGDGPESFRLLQRAVKSRDIRVRIYAMICQINNSHEFVNKMVEAGVITGTGDERFKVGPAKLFTDGSSTGPTIATRESYSSDRNNYGILYYNEEEIYQVLGEAHKKVIKSLCMHKVIKLLKCI